MNKYFADWQGKKCAKCGMKEVVNNLLLCRAFEIPYYLWHTYRRTVNRFQKRKNISGREVKYCWGFCSKEEHDRRMMDIDRYEIGTWRKIRRNKNGE